jgi:hypothetical protein
MAASGHHMNMPGAPTRTASSLSHLAYHSDGMTTPVVPPLPRAYSHSGMSPVHYPVGGRDTMYSVPQQAYSQPYTFKGADATKWPIYETPDSEGIFGKGE